MARTSVLPTRVLLICAAIGVATGLIGGIAGWVTPILLASPLLFLYGLVLGSHVLPGIIAQEVLRRPFVALITHLIAALVSSAFNPAWALRFIGTALLFGAIQEGVAAHPLPRLGRLALLHLGGADRRRRGGRRVLRRTSRHDAAVGADHIPRDLGARPHRVDRDRPRGRHGAQPRRRRPSLSASFPASVSLDSP